MIEGLDEASEFPTFSPGPGERLIELTKGAVTIVSEQDYEWLMQWSWHVQVNKRDGKKYAARKQKTPDGRSQKVYMHRAIAFRHKKPEGRIVVDHENCNGLDNRRKNLRASTQSKNCANRFDPVASTGYRGVRQEPGGRFRASITHEGKTIHLGMHSTALKAAKAYDKEARKLFGKFAMTNARLLGWRNAKTFESVVTADIPFPDLPVEDRRVA